MTDRTTTGTTQAGVAQLGEQQSCKLPRAGSMPVTGPIPFQPNHRTHERKRRARELERQRLINRIGMKLEDAPLFDEELRFMAYEASIKGQARN